jgi:hypothetical protein
MASVERNSAHCLSLCNTKHSFQKLLFILQVCPDLLETVKSGDVNSTKILFIFAINNCTTDEAYGDTPLIYAALLGHV